MRKFQDVQVPRLVKEAIEINRHKNFNRGDGFKLSSAWNPVLNLINSNIRPHTKNKQPSDVTSQDAGDTSSVTDSGIESEKRPSVSIIKSTRDSIKRKVQSIAHDSDEAVIEPLLHKEKPEVHNQATKYSLLKSKGEIINAKESDKQRLITEKITKVSMSAVPSLTDNKLINEKKQFPVSSNTSTSGYKYNYTNTNEPCHPEAKSPLKSNTQLLVEIDGAKPAATYDASPLIFTTAKIHSDGVTKNLEPYQVTTVPILSTIESGDIKFGYASENGKQIQSVPAKKENSLNESYKDNLKASTAQIRNTKDSAKVTPKHYDLDIKSNFDSKLLSDMSSNTIRMTAKERSEKTSPSARSLNEALINTDLNKNISTFSNTNFNVHGAILNKTKTEESQSSCEKNSSGVSASVSGSKLLRQKNAITDDSTETVQTVQNNTKSFNDNNGLLTKSSKDTSYCASKIKEENNTSNTSDRPNAKFLEQTLSAPSKTRSFSASSSDKPSTLTKTLAKIDSSSPTIKGSSLESITKPVIASAALTTQKAEFDASSLSSNKMERYSNNKLTSTIPAFKAVSKSSDIQSPLVIIDSQIQSKQSVSSSYPFTVGTSEAITTKATTGSSNSFRTSSVSSKPNTTKVDGTLKSSVSGKHREAIQNSELKQNVKSSKA